MEQEKETNRNYTEIDTPYNSFLERSEQSSDNGDVMNQPVKSDGDIGDVWIRNFIRSENWKPKSVGFYINGQTGYAEFMNVFISGDIQATTGTIGGFTINATNLSATSGGNTTILSSGSVAFSAGPTGSPSITITQAGVLTATGATITGTIQTASGTGQRIVIASADNTLTFYNASNAVVAQLGAGASIGNALRITLDASTTTGVRVTSSTANDIGFSFVNSGNYDSAGLNVDLSGATNTGTGVNINHDGSSGEGVYIDISAGARGLQIANTGSGVCIYITNSASGSMYISHTHDSSKGIEIDYSGRQQALYLNGTDTDSSLALLYATAGQADGTETVKFNKSNYGPVLYVVSSNSSNNNYSVGIKMDITSSGSSNEAAFEFIGAEYISSATSVSSLTGVVKVVTSDGLCYIPIYSSYS